MTSTEVAPARTTTPWIGAGVVAALLLVGGLLPGWTVDVRMFENGIATGSGPVHGHDYSLLADSEWPYYLALILALAGAALAAAAHGRGAAWVAPTVLTVAAVPALALVTELFDLSDSYAPYSRSVDQAEAEAMGAGGGRPVGGVETALGGWITALTMLALAVGAVVWLGRSLTFLADQRYAAAALVLIVAVSVVGYQIAEAAANDTCDPGRPIDPDDVSWDWVFWLVLYLPAVMAGIGVGAMTRRRIGSGVFLVAGAIAAFVGMVVIGVEVASPCLE